MEVFLPAKGAVIRKRDTVTQDSTTIRVPSTRIFPFMVFIP